MWEEINELEYTLLHILQEGLARCCKYRTDGVGSNLLFHSDCRVDFEKLVGGDGLSIVIVDFDRSVNVLIFDLYRSSRGVASGKKLRNIFIDFWEILDLQLENIKEKVLTTRVGGLVLLDTVYQSGYDLIQVGSKLVAEDSSHDTKEQEAAFPQPSAS